jgi:putative salt-induced outer membrane protein YdiY
MISVCLFAAEEETKTWTNKTELSAVWTGGNSSSSTIGFKNDYRKKFGSSNLKILVNGLRAESSTFNRFAVGSEDDFELVEDETSELTAERYQFLTQYDQMIEKKLFWFTRLDWTRNQFAGIDNRYEFAGGLGHQWIDTDTRKFKTSYGIQYTVEDQVVDIEGEDDNFVSGNLAYTLMTKFGNATFDQDAGMTVNLDETDDFRLNLTNGLSAQLIGKMALKVGLELIYDNNPSFELVPLQGSTLVVPFELDELDTAFTASLVIDW